MDSVDELHAELALADTWVADTVVPFVERGVYKPAAVDVVGELRKFDARAAGVRAVTDDEHQGLIDAYREYAALLVEVYEEFLTHASGDA